MSVEVLRDERADRGGVLKLFPALESRERGVIEGKGRLRVAGSSRGKRLHPFQMCARGRRTGGVGTAERKGIADLLQGGARLAAIDLAGRQVLPRLDGEHVSGIAERVAGGLEQRL